MQASGKSVPGGALQRAGRATFASALVFAFWLIISASLAPVDVLLGLLVSVLLGSWSARFLWGGQAPRLGLRQVLALIRFLAGLWIDILRAALHVAGVVLNPRLPIDPVMIVCRTSLKDELARVAFAQSVTLTPGTLTVDMDGGTFLIHCLDRTTAEQLASGELERRIARVFEPESAT